MKKKNILLVEDNLDDITLTRRIFAKSEISSQVIVAEDGAEALDYLFGTGIYQGKDLNDLPALVLLDLNLPKLNGRDVLKSIRKDSRTKRIPVVILTSSNDEKDKAFCYDNGANSYVCKPVDYLQFSETIRQIEKYWLVVNELPFEL